MVAREGLHDLPGWLLNELASAGRENLDPDHVLRYDDKEDAASADEVELCHSLGMTGESTVVEFGSGTGQFAVAVASQCQRLVAVDVSEVMISALRSKIARLALSNVEMVQAGFLTYRHEGRPADIVYSRYALHHLPDFWKADALRRIASILRSGGHFRLWDVIYNFEPQEARDRIEAWCSTGGASTLNEWTRSELEEHVRDENSTYRWLLEPMIERAGLSIQAVEFSNDGLVGRYVLRKP
jgi:ubiquinone/menaquinone biosynthesis C-methylase UbiE